jgi:hypothetical protein
MRTLPRRSTALVRTLPLAAVLSLAGAGAAAAQSSAAGAQPGRHTAVCAAGVRVYTDIKDVPVPHDTLKMPPMDGQIRVTNAQEAEAAELAMRGRAGSVGATGVLVLDDVQNDGGNMIVRRRGLVPVFVPADSARALQVCRK